MTDNKCTKCYKNLIGTVIFNNCPITIDLSNGAGKGNQTPKLPQDYKDKKGRILKRLLTWLSNLILSAILSYAISNMIDTIADKLN